MCCVGRLHFICLAEENEDEKSSLSLRKAAAVQYIHSGETEKKVRINIGSGTKVERKNLDEMDDTVTAEKNKKNKKRKSTMHQTKE